MCHSYSVWIKNTQRYKSRSQLTCFNKKKSKTAFNLLISIYCYKHTKIYWTTTDTSVNKEATEHSATMPFFLSHITTPHQCPNQQGSSNIVHSSYYPRNGKKTACKHLGEWHLQCLVSWSSIIPTVWERPISFANSLNNPILLAQWTAVVLFHPKGHTTVMEGVVALSPHHNTVLLLVFSLTTETCVHYLDPTNGTGIAFNIPTPHCHCIPLLERKHLVTAWFRSSISVMRVD